VVGKTRVAKGAMINGGWQGALYVTSRGLTTSPIPYGERTFQVDFDFIDHELRIGTSGGAAHSFALRPQSVADFYREFMAGLRSPDIEGNILTPPPPVGKPLPSQRKTEHAAYHPEDDPPLFVPPPR